jgi:hypothetical protein
MGPRRIRIQHPSGAGPLTASSNAIAHVCRDGPTVGVNNMNWLVNIYADIPHQDPARPFVEQSPMFTDWESIGGTQRRITLTVPDTAADDAGSACEVAKRELEKRLTMLRGISECNATRLD